MKKEKCPRVRRRKIRRGPVIEHSCNGVLRRLYARWTVEGKAHTKKTDFLLCDICSTLFQEVKGQVVEERFREIGFSKNRELAWIHSPNAGLSDLEQVFNPKTGELEYREKTEEQKEMEKRMMETTKTGGSKAKEKEIAKLKTAMENMSASASK